MKTEVTAVVLAGGVGRRFWPITVDKCLLEFLDKPLIGYTLRSLRGVGIRHIVVIANPRNRKAIETMRLGFSQFHVVVQQSPRGMADALLTAERVISGKSILVINGADLVDPSLYRQVLAKAKKGKDEVIIPALERKEYFVGGYLKLKGEQVIGIVEKPQEGKQPSNLVNLVSHYFSSSTRFLREIRKVQPERDDAYELALSVMISQKGAALVRYKGPFGFVKFPWDILEMMQLFLRQKMRAKISSKAKIHPSAVIEGPVAIATGVRVLEHAVIKGPSFIGENALIGTGSLVLESMINKSTVVGFASEVTRSYVGSNSWLHQNYIGDSILEGENCLGAGAITANFRFDEGPIHSWVNEERVSTKKTKFGAVLGSRSRIGVNTSLMPGVKIGEAAIVGPGIVVYKDVPSHKAVLGKEMGAPHAKGK